MSESSAPPTEPRGARDGGGGTPAVSPANAPAPGGPAESAPHDPLGHHEENHGFRVWRMTRPVVLAMSAACLAVFWGAGALLRIPSHYGYEASLLQQPGIAAKLLAVLAAAFLFLACALLVQLVAAQRWVLVGPFAAAVGLAAWSVRGGPSVYVYRMAGTAGYGARVFPMLLLELILLFVAIGLTWWLLVGRMELLVQQASDDAPPGPPKHLRKTSRRSEASLLGRVQGLATQVAIIGLIALVLTATADKAQVLASVLIASIVGTGLAEHYFKDERLGPWLWAGPLIVGALGYLLTWMTGDSAVATETGRVTGAFAPLARPLPLDYASFGTAGALLGYWMAADMPHILAKGLYLALGGHVVIGERKVADESQEPTELARSGNGQVR
jgi:hypothetical protein